MKRLIGEIAVEFALAFVFAGGVFSQTTLNIWPGVAPGSEKWTQKEVTTPNTPVGTVITNVVTPTITAYLPEPKQATGMGVIVAPGGFCIALAMDRGGTDVAEWLQAKGIAAFVLKYRTQEKKQDGIPKDLDMDAACKFGIADAIQSIKVVREHAKDWHIDPNKVGIVGFSAGGMVASGALFQSNVEERPNFAALIYGAPFGAMPKIPSSLPPLFLAWAQDDELAGPTIDSFYTALRAAGNKPEVHIYSTGGHGFGTAPQGKSNDHWVDQMYVWLREQSIK
ncbi:MAG TPA: alpha/beta hydrolase [Pyrinomonadaceae bacterium]|nr:alpha/beta hydrolase [Pyrinomonadaceae bacterium]